jgi:hypothetical protein
MRDLLTDIAGALCVIALPLALLFIGHGLGY